MKKTERILERLKRRYREEPFHKDYIHSMRIDGKKITIKLKKLLPNFTLGSALYFPHFIDGVKINYVGTKKLDKLYYASLKKDGFTKEAEKFRKLKGLK